MNRIYVSIGVLFLVYELFCYLPPRNIQPEDVIGHPPTVSGVVHIHSNLSDGSGTVEEIATAARGAGLNFFVLTDHNNANARKLGFEKNYEGVDAFVEMEVSTPAGHLLSFYSQTEARDWKESEIIDITWRHYLGEKTIPGLFAYIAHPSNHKTPWSRIDKFTDGIEVVNFDSLWQKQFSDNSVSFITTVLIAPFNPFLAALRFFQFPKKDFNTWDTMNSLNPGGSGILAHDAHAKIKMTPSTDFRFPDYLRTFKLASNVVFLEEPPVANFESRKRQIYQRLKKGHSAFVLQAIYPYKGNDFKLVCGDGTYRSGDKANLRNKDCNFEIYRPKNFLYPRIVRLLRNSEVIKESVQNEPIISFPVDAPGSYRLEVSIRTPIYKRLFAPAEIPYLYYNPIYVH